MLKALAEMKGVSRQRVAYIVRLNEEQLQGGGESAQDQLLKRGEAEEQIAALENALWRQTLSAKKVELLSRESISCITLLAETDELSCRAEVKRSSTCASRSETPPGACVRQSAAEYNEVARRIELIPAEARYSFQLDHTLRLRPELDKVCDPALNNSRTATSVTRSAAIETSRSCSAVPTGQANHIVALFNERKGKMTRCSRPTRSHGHEAPPAGLRPHHRSRRPTR